MAIYHFHITIAGSGNNEDEAWRDAVESFSLDPGPTPELPEEVEEIEEEEHYR